MYYEFEKNYWRTIGELFANYWRTIQELLEDYWGTIQLKRTIEIPKELLRIVYKTAKGTRPRKRKRPRYVH